VTGQPYAVRLSPPAANVLAELPEHAEEMVWDVLVAAAADPWGFRQWDVGDTEGEAPVRAMCGRPAVPPRRLPVRAI
jgi:hypothetical protein